MEQHSRTPPEPIRDAPGPEKPRRRADYTQTLARIAKNGIITTAHARENGIPGKALERRVANGTLLRDRPGVYRFAGWPRGDDPAQQRLALACSHAKALCLWSANHALGVEPARPTEIHVAVRATSHVESTDWYTAHRLRPIERDEITKRHEVAVTTAARTIRDFAATLSATDWNQSYVNRWVEEALMQNLLTIEALEAQRDREKGPHVRGRLDRLIGYHTGRGTEDLKSRGEAWLRDFLEEKGLPIPLFNARVPGTNLDADVFFPFVPLILEFDSFAYHRTRGKLDRDAQRRRRTLRQGIPTMPVTAFDLLHDRAQLEDDLLWALGGGFNAPENG